MTRYGLDFRKRSGSVEGVLRPPDEGEWEGRPLGEAPGQSAPASSLESDAASDQGLSLQLPAPVLCLPCRGTVRFK